MSAHLQGCKLKIMAMDSSDRQGQRPSSEARRKRPRVQRGRKQQGGPLAGHFKQGRVFRPPFLAIPQFELQDWVRDDLADLIWPVLVIADGGDGAAPRLGRFQVAAQELCGASPEVTIDGRLTSLERIPNEHRAALVKLCKEHREVFPPELIGILRLYPDAPGAWLLKEPWNEEPAPGEAKAMSLLGAAIVRVVADGHLTALVKFVPLAWTVVTGRGTFGTEIVDLLRDYPSVPSKFPAADSVIRASFGAQRGVRASREGGRLIAEEVAWARRFWTRNWQIAPCIPEEVAGQDDDSAHYGEDSEGTEKAQSAEEEGLSQRASEVSSAPSDQLAALSQEAQDAVLWAFNAFLDVVLDPDLPVDLYAPARHEVVTGLASRAARAALALARSPELWSGEHSSSTTRLLAETEIFLRWMDQQDEGAFDRFQRYGTGKQKLMRRNLEGLAIDIGGAGSEDLADALEHLTAKTGGEHGEQFQEVNLDATFAGVSLREMASQCDADELYRHVYQPASGITHGEWWAVEDYATQRCLNPLHRFHRIPSFAAQFPPTAGLGKYLAQRTKQVLAIAERMLRQ